MFDNAKIVSDYSECEVSNRGRFVDLFQTGREKLTIMLWILWFVAAAGYYGMVLLSTELLNSTKDYCGVHSAYELRETSINLASDFIKKSSPSENTCSLQCG